MKSLATAVAELIAADFEQHDWRRGESHVALEAVIDTMWDTPYYIQSSHEFTLHRWTIGAHVVTAYNVPNHLHNDMRAYICDPSWTRDTANNVCDDDWKWFRKVKRIIVKLCAAAFPLSDSESGSDCGRSTNAANAIPDLADECRYLLGTYIEQIDQRFGRNTAGQSKKLLPREYPNFVANDTPQLEPFPAPEGRIIFVKMTVTNPPPPPRQRKRRCRASRVRHVSVGPVLFDRTFCFIKQTVDTDVVFMQHLIRHYKWNDNAAIVVQTVFDLPAVAKIWCVQIARNPYDTPEAVLKQQRRAMKLSVRTDEMCFGAPEDGALLSVVLADLLSDSAEDGGDVVSESADAQDVNESVRGTRTTNELRSRQATMEDEERTEEPAGDDGSRDDWHNDWYTGCSDTSNPPQTLPQTRTPQPRVIVVDENDDDADADADADEPQRKRCRVNWQALCLNELPAAVYAVLTHPEHIHWPSLSQNSNLTAVTYLTRHRDRIDWPSFCANKNPMAMALLAENPQHIDWEILSRNPSEGAWRILSAEMRRHTSNL